MSTAEQLLHEPPTPWMPDDDPPCKHCGRTFAPGYSDEECPVRLRAEVGLLRADRERLYARNVGAAIAALDAAGYGKPGTPNTLRDMVQEAVAEVERLTLDKCALVVNLTESTLDNGKLRMLNEMLIRSAGRMQDERDAALTDEVTP